MHIVMSKSEKNIESTNQRDKKPRGKVVKDPKTGLLFLSGPKVTREKVEKDFPLDSDRDAIIIRRSVGL